MSTDAAKGRKSFFERYGTKSLAYETMWWLLLWGLYALWAGYSPMHPGSHRAENVFPFVVVAFMAMMFLAGDREELKLLVLNSILAAACVPGFLGLNIYRAMTFRFPEAWSEANLLFSPAAFILVQVLFLWPTYKLLKYTQAKWNASPRIVSRRDYLGCLGLLVVLLILIGLAIVFISVGKGHDTP